MRPVYGMVTMGSSQRVEDLVDNWCRCREEGNDDAVTKACA